jgi:hypothetical protein
MTNDSERGRAERLERELEAATLPEANHRSTPELIDLFLQAGLDLYDPQHYDGLISMYVVGQVIGLEDRTRLLEITKALINTGLLVQDPNTEEIGLFRFTPKGLAIARQHKGS